MRILQGRDGSISVRLEAERGDPVRGNRTYETVEMMDPMTGNPLVAIVEPGKYPEGTKITGEMYARVTRERDELLAALKSVVDDFEFVDREAHEAFQELIAGDCEYGGRQTIIAARALIAKIEGEPMKGHFTSAELDRQSEMMGVLRRRASPEVRLPRARGRALSAIALDQYGMRRRWYERAPWFGDRWLRRRMRDAWKRPPRQRPAGVPVEAFQREMAEIQGLWKSLWRKLRGNR